jgi:prepilin-type processing-associated H-X9-DG protein
LLFDGGYFKSSKPFYCPSSGNDIWSVCEWNPWPYNYNAGYFPTLLHSDVIAHDFVNSGGYWEAKVWDLGRTGTQAMYVDVILRQKYLAHKWKGLNVAFGDGHVSWYIMNTPILAHISAVSSHTTMAADYYWLADYFKNN